MLKKGDESIGWYTNLNLMKMKILNEYENERMCIEEDCTHRRRLRVCFSESNRIKGKQRGRKNRKKRRVP